MKNSFKKLLLLIPFILVFSFISCKEAKDPPEYLSWDSETVITFDMLYKEAQNLGYEGSKDEFLELIRGDDGAEGKSAYDIAKEEGFVGNEAEWLESIKGKDGKNGKDGISPTIEIDSQGYWVINGTKTSIMAAANHGSDGVCNCENIHVVEINTDGYWVIDGNITTVKAEATNGKDGEDGLDITEIFINDEGNLIIAFSDGSTKDLGVVAPSEKIHTVTFELDDSTPVTTKTVPHLLKIEKPDDPKREGYILEGWYCLGEKWIFSGYVVTEDITLVAHFVPCTSHIDKDWDTLCDACGVKYY